MRWFASWQSSVSGPKRGQLWIDRSVQGALVSRAILYAAATLVYFITIQFFNTRVLEGQQSLTQWSLSVTDEAVFWVPGLLVLGPLMVHDLLATSNRFVGPVYALRRQLRELADGNDGRPIAFREGDHWSAMADEFNAVRAELIERRRNSSP